VALWDGRFEGTPALLMQRYGESLSTDLLMWRQDLAGSRAHARMLCEVGILDDDELEAILGGLDTVGEELEAGWVPGIELEDIHMAVEHRLHELIGPAAGKLHTARSRNDQVATDVRLWLREKLDELIDAVGALVDVLVDRAERDGKVLVPGTTHLQRAQPIWIAHQILAYAWMLERDRQRLSDCRKRANLSPLGSAALAGTPHPIDRSRTAALLGFDGVVENAMDGVSSRDHLIEAASACAILSSHLSRMAEELVIWSTPEFSRVRLGDEWSTGSSIMPQKRNPDAPELVRGRTARAYGGLFGLLTMVKSTPLAYNRDFQEDRPALFPAVLSTLDSVRVMAGCWESLEITADVPLEGDFLLATELADYLASKGVPFREAHHVTGRLVKLCEDRGTDLRGLTLDDLTAAHEAFAADVFDWLQPRAAAERRTSRGGTAWSEVIRQAALLRARLRS
jgi:argininosuccinate lyase